MHFGNRGPHFELMGQTLGGIFAFLLRQESQTPIERARSVGVCAIRILHDHHVINGTERFTLTIIDCRSLDFAGCDKSSGFAARSVAFASAI
jgi:hypothetical protein